MLQRRKFFQGRRIRGADVKDISWLDPSGGEMTDEAWSTPDVKCLGVRLAGDVIDDVDERGEPIVGDTLLLLLNADDAADVVHAAGDDAGRAVGDAARHGRSATRRRGGSPAASATSCSRDRWSVLKLNCRKEDLRRSARLGTDGGLLTTRATTCERRAR